MSKIITPIEAVIEHVTDIKEDQYGVYKSVLFKTPDGEKIWKSFPPDSEELSILTKGAKVRLIPKSATLCDSMASPSYVIEPMDRANQPAEAPPTKATQSGMSDEQKREVAAYIEQMGVLYRFAYGQAAQHLRGMTQSEETLRCCASALFISAQRKFNL